MRKVFLDELPRKEGIGKYKDIIVIDWNNCIGMSVKFIYDNFSGMFIIKKYYKIKNDYYIKFDYNGQLFNMNIKNFKDAYFKNIINNEFIYDVGNQIHSLIVIKRYKNKYGTKKYDLICNVCHASISIYESKLISIKNCPKCYQENRINPEDSIVISDPWMIPYFQGGYDEAKLYTYNSSKEIYPICPDCGSIRNKLISIYNIHNHHSIGCGCSDGKSYPNKFVEYFLRHLNVNYETEKSFNWSNRKIYDDYIEDFSCIIENHGLGHYEKGFEKTFSNARSLQKEQENDKLKEQLAKENNIQYYIVLDCRKSELEWIKQSVMESELPTLFNFTENDIDWLKCHEFACKNIVKEVCFYKKNNPDSFSSEISKVFNLHVSTVIEYLKSGTQLGWCDYCAEDEKLRNYKNTSLRLMIRNKSNLKKVVVYKDNIVYGIYNSCNDLVNESEKDFGVKFKKQPIYVVCNGKQKEYCGYKFKYVS